MNTRKQILALAASKTVGHPLRVALLNVLSFEIPQDDPPDEIERWLDSTDHAGLAWALWWCGAVPADIRELKRVEHKISDMIYDLLGIVTQLAISKVETKDIEVDFSHVGGRQEAHLTLEVEVIPDWADGDPQEAVETEVEVAAEGPKEVGFTGVLDIDMRGLGVALMAYGRKIGLREVGPLGSLELSEFESDIEAEVLEHIEELEFTMDSRSIDSLSDSVSDAIEISRYGEAEDVDISAIVSVNEDFPIGNSKFQIRGDSLYVKFTSDVPVSFSLEGG